MPDLERYLSQNQINLPPEALGASAQDVAFSLEKLALYYKQTDPAAAKLLSDRANQIKDDCVAKTSNS